MTEFFLNAVEALIATTLVSDQLYSYDHLCKTPFELRLKCCNEKLP